MSLHTRAMYMVITILHIHVPNIQIFAFLPSIHYNTIYTSSFFHRRYIVKDIHAIKIIISTHECRISFTNTARTVHVFWVCHTTTSQCIHSIVSLTWAGGGTFINRKLETHHNEIQIAKSKLLTLSSIWTTLDETEPNIRPKKR